MLPGLLALRDALYSQQFREFLQKVTGCGALSGTKQDMSVNSYKSGCHLLNHDDVIGSRCVSYILYMPLPAGNKWEEVWGGALELYPVVENGEPETIPSKKIPPAWNQFIFFEVQPGRSFHSVEEVIVGGGNDPRERLSISGWFHKAQEGEVGYTPEPSDREKSSLEQLVRMFQFDFIARKSVKKIEYRPRGLIECLVLILMIAHRQFPQSWMRTTRSFFPNL